MITIVNIIDREIKIIKNLINIIQVSEYVIQSWKWHVIEGEVALEIGIVGRKKKVNQVENFALVLVDIWGKWWFP